MRRILGLSSLFTLAFTAGGLLALAAAKRLLRESAPDDSQTTTEGVQAL